LDRFTLPERIFVTAFMNLFLDPSLECTVFELDLILFSMALRLSGTTGVCLAPLMLYLGKAGNECPITEILKVCLEVFSHVGNPGVLQLVLPRYIEVVVDPLLLELQGLKLLLDHGEPHC
jgi:hypothetical protein